MHEYLQRKPVTGISGRDLALTNPTVAAALARMQDRQIVRELTGCARNRVFAYAPDAELLSEGTEPLG